MGFKELMDSKCERDYKSRHYWESIGVFANDSGIYRVWHCTQCDKSIYEKLELLE